ncbi:hypothetical protein BU17DRAFT_43277 [Hysterangium stoloniferum]|nr:hypothetical protein BU17DRAFT_43277 [Hysterangium stoloniferum]
MPKSVLFTSTDRTCRYVIMMLLSSPNCPAITVITRSGQNLRDSFPPPLLATPHRIVVTDHFEGASFTSAFDGISLVFHDGLAIDPKAGAASFAVIEASKSAGVDHFIFSSIIQPIRTKLHTHKMKLGIEEHLVESRLNYTILQPSQYMQNVALNNALSTGNIPIGFSPTIMHGFMDMTDLTAVVRTIMSKSRDHLYARYELVAENISYNDIAHTISETSGKLVQCEVFSAKEFVRKMRAAGEVQGEYAEDVLERLMMYYNRWGIVGNSNVLRWLLGREPVAWEQYIGRELRSMET